MSKLKLLLLLLAFPCILFAQNQNNTETPENPVRKKYVEKAEKVNPVIYSKGAVIITQPSLINVDNDPVKITLPVNIKRGVDLFSNDVFTQDIIAEGQAILFIFNQQDLQTVTLNKMLDKRDLAFINDKDKIVEIRRGVGQKDGILRTAKPAIAVLQLSAGSLNKFGIKLNSEVTLVKPSEVIN